MQSKLERALDTLFYFKHRQLLREGFEKIFECTLEKPSSSAINFSLLNVVQYYPHGNKILRDADVLATLTKLFTVADEQIGLNNEAIQEALVHTVAQFARLEGELVQLRRRDKPKAALHLMSDSEYNILLDHKFQLEQNIESLEKQVNFLRDTKKKNEDKLRDQIERQLQQITTLNGLLEQTSKAKDECLIDLTEKEKTLQTTLVHLTTAQEEIRRLTNERSQSKLKEKQDADEINDIIQRHSKYSAAQFTQLSAQCDALRAELKKEKTERLRERDDWERENTQLKKKLHTSETMAEALNKRFLDVASVGLHNYNVQTGSALPADASNMNKLSLPPQNKRNSSSPDEDNTQEYHEDDLRNRRGADSHPQRRRYGTPLSRSSSRSRGRTTSNASNAVKEDDDEGDHMTTGGKSHSSASVSGRSASNSRSRYYQQVENKTYKETKEFKHEGPIKSLRTDPDYRHRLAQQEESRRRARSESPSFRGKHILYQPGTIQTPSFHRLGQSLQHPLKSSLADRPEISDDLAQRLVYSQNTSVLSPNSKRHLKQQDSEDLIPRPPPISILHSTDPHHHHGNGTVASDPDSDAISSIPRADGDDDDNVLMFDPQHGHDHPPLPPTSSEKPVSLNTSPVQLRSRSISHTSASSGHHHPSPRMTDYMFDINRLPHDMQQAYHHMSPVRSDTPDQMHRSPSHQHPSSSSASSASTFAVSSTLPSHSPNRLAHSLLSSGENVHRMNHSNNDAILSPLTSPSPAAISNRNNARYFHASWAARQQHPEEPAPELKEIAVQTERSDTLMEHMRGGMPAKQPSQSVDVSLKFTNKAPVSHTSGSADAIHYTHSSDNNNNNDAHVASLETPQQRNYYDLFPHQLQPDGDETVVSMSTALPPNHPLHTVTPHRDHSNQHASNPTNPMKDTDATNNNNAWNILYQKKEYLDMDQDASISFTVSSEETKQSMLVRATLLQQVLDVYNHTVDDYNALLRAHREEYAEHERVKSDFKEEIYESVSKIHDLQTKLHALSLENDHLQSVLNKRGLDGMTIASNPGEESLLLQQQVLLNQQTQEMLQHMQEQWLQSEQKVAELITNSTNQANMNNNNMVEYALGLDRTIQELPKLISLFEDNCQLLTNIPSEKIVVSKLFVWDLLHVLNNIQHQLLRQMHQSQVSVESLEKKNASLQQELASAQSRCQETEQEVQTLQTQYETQRQELAHHQSLHIDWQHQQERLKHQYQELQAQLIRQEQEHETLLQERLQQEYDSWRSKHFHHQHENIAKDERLKQQQQQQEAADEEEKLHVQQLKMLHEQLAQTRQALEEMKLTQEEARQEDQSLLKLLMESSSSPHHLQQTSHSNGLHTHHHHTTTLNTSKEAHYQEDLHYISDMKTRLDHLHQLLAKDPKYRQYVVPVSETDQEHDGEEEDDDEVKSETSEPPSRAHHLQLDQVQSLMLTKLELEDRLLRAEARVQLLTQQLENMPPSLTVAQAEKRVLEAKLAKAMEAHDFNIQKIQTNAVQKIQEINAFLDLEKQEKETLQLQLQDSQATVHRLTHHLKLLQAQGRELDLRQTATQALYSGHATGSGTHASFMSTAVALDILKQEQQQQKVALKEAALTSLGLSLGRPAPWEAGALPRTTSSHPVATTTSASSLESLHPHPTTSNNNSRRGTPQRQRSGGYVSQTNSPAKTSHKEPKSPNPRNHHDFHSHTTQHSEPVSHKLRASSASSHSLHSSGLNATTTKKMKPTQEPFHFQAHQQQPKSGMRHSAHSTQPLFH